MIIAVFQTAVGFTQMEAVAFTVAEHGAVGADAGAHPSAVAVELKPVLPHIPEIVGVDISLMIVCPDARTCTD